ncbi:MAG: hypothetical protein KKI09_06375 [Spirochaetes bacterium]|nr:hypothetical protein [Spirochaetota bacterium]MBU0955037.1 hypothetical protein [Spirochaetota bacterium]
MMDTLRKMTVLIALLCAVVLQSAAQTALFSTSVAVNWEQGQILAEIAYDLNAAGLRLPAGRSQAERAIESMMTHQVRPAILEIGVDSWRTVLDCIQDQTIDAAALELFLESGKKSNTRLSDDQQRLIINYQFSLHDLAAMFVRHTSPVEQAGTRVFAPTRDYSGILIYVQGQYPVRGEHRSGILKPSLFPRIYDENMRLLMERNFVNPADMKRWSSVGWAPSLDSPVIEQRLGQDPLRIMAYSIFGTRLSDLILSDSDAQKILGSANNRNLIRQGRVVIVYNP